MGECACAWLIKGKCMCVCIGPAGWVFPNATDDGVGLRGRLEQAAALKPELWPTEFGYAHTHARAHTGIGKYCQE